MADVVQMPGVLEQLKLIGRLRWQLMRNGLRHKNSRWDLIGIILAGAMSGLLVLGLCFAFYAGGHELIRKGHASWLSLLFWGIFMWWQVVPIFSAGFCANFEFRNLLRFPLSLRTFYILGLGYGFADFAAVSSMCWLASLVAGVAAARIHLLPVMLLISVLFILVCVTLERWIGSWMERIFANRRAREFLIGFFVLSMVSLNFLNPAFQRWGDRGIRPKIFQYFSYLSWLPGSLAGNAVASGVRADLAGVLIGCGGLLVWVGVTSVLLWLRFRSQYFGEELSDSVAPAATKRRVRKQSSATTLPSLLPSQIAAVVSKEFHYLTRNGFSAITFLLPPIMVMFFSMQFAGKNPTLKAHGLSPQLFFPGMMAYLILILLSPAYNSFAFEGRGVQSYFMAPVRMRNVLMGKNLFLVCIVTIELAICLGVLVWRVGFPGWALFLSTVTAAAFAVAGQ